MAEDQDDDFDFIQPTLIQQLKNILDDYPDDGQILKELIQNAEDAGAKEVKFLFDNRTYGKSKLHCPELQQFQGPALYAYNDAEFKPDDWKGVRMISDSIKAKDPMKVGRFGLGFKSVFHLTDLPSVISNTQLGMIDPHEKYFKDKSGRSRTGKKWNLGKPNSNMESIPDQFEPYKGVFNCSDESFKSGHYPGTLFRFPLRQQPSELSDTVYTTEKMIGLFECFQTDAQLTLLFLKRLESIELYVRHEGDTSPTKVFQVNISKDSLDEVRSKRKEFLEKISSSGELKGSVTVTYPITIETTEFREEAACHAVQHTFIVTDYYAGGEISSELSNLTAEKSLSYLPWVGVALPLPPKSNRSIPRNDSVPPTDPCGHLFCFLPLPLTKQSPTGLPVHVNGFFALSKNRRHLKWPSADQDESKPLTDKSLLWNKCLLRDVLPRAYAELLRQTIHLSARLCENVSAEIVYNAWPDIEKVDVKWKELTELFCKEVLDDEILHTDVDGGKWIQPKDAILDKLQESSQVKQAIISTLYLDHENIVTAPAHVVTAVTTHYKNRIREITPSLVRDVLKNIYPKYTMFDRRIKLSLLGYILSDKRVSELCGLELLPLSDGRFTAFDTNGCCAETQVYVASPDHPQSLLPGLESMFLDQTIDPEIVRQLREAAETECLQLRLLKQSDVQRLLHKVLPNQQNERGHVNWYPHCPGQRNPPAGWLEEVWLYLGKNFRDCLGHFLGLHLIEVETSADSVTLAQLQCPTTLVVCQLNGWGLNETLVNVLRTLGLTVIDALPSFIKSHPQCFQYLNQPTVQGVLKAISVMNTMNVQTLVSKLQENTSAEEKRELRTFLSQEKSLKAKEKELVRSLPLFETLDGSGNKASHFVPASQVQWAAPIETLPVNSAELLIDTTDDESKRLAQLVGVKQLKITELLTNIVLPGVEKNIYSENEVDCLMLYVIERLPQYRAENKTFEQCLKSLPFVSRSSDGLRVKPSQLFDPNVKTLEGIFLHEQELFPSVTFRDDTTLGELRKLGLKKEGNITANDILRSVNQIESISDNNKANTKSEAILEFLNRNPSKLQDCVSLGVSLVEAIYWIPWVATMKVKPSYYPDNLPLYSAGTSPFERPHNMVSSTKRLLSLVGTVKPTVQADLYPVLEDHFHWEKDPQLEHVITHFKSVISTYVPQNKASYLVIVTEIYQYLSTKDHDLVNKALNEAGIERWIWNGDGFSSPAKMILEKAFTDLSPYVNSLPSEMNPFSGLFLGCGVKIREDHGLLVTVLHELREKYEIQTETTGAEVKHDLQLSIDILNELKPTVGKEMPREIYEQLLLPTDVENDVTLRLTPIEDCTYCDTEWLKQGHDVYDVEDEDDVKLQYVHRNIPPSTAECLGVPTLMSRILDPDQLGLGEEYGQSEPLTRRLHRLLEDYTDGFAVPKELIQNADDAGATEVKLLYDERTNEEARTCLIDEGMQEWQGPALWAYNDAVFTDEDFENITKLSEGSKENDSEKIGRFGLGFNAVYNLTDVPSFVSRNNIVIFDPHTTHLGKAVRNKSKPGIKIDMMKNKKKLRKLRNQFKPYNGIFGCELSPDAKQTSFNGTLFRFPLRNRSQADRSEIKKLFYDADQMKKLLKMVVHGADSLLLFTQNVQKVTLFHLSREAKDPSQAVELFQIVKKPISTLREHGVDIKLSDAAAALTNEDKSFLRECNFLKASSQVLQTIKLEPQVNRSLPESSMKIKVMCSFSKTGHNFFAGSSTTDLTKCQAWLVSSSMGKDLSLEKAKGDESLRPTAGVAVRLAENNSTSLDHPSQVSGHVFCYLPLPIHSGLPVHINGGFAVTSNRRYLKERTEDDKDESGGDWNEMLLKDAVCKAYVNAMYDLRTTVAANNTAQSFYEVWPTLQKVERLSHPLRQAFYTSLVKDSLELFTDGKKWADMEHALFLDPELRQIPLVGDVALKVLRQVSNYEDVVVDLPSTVTESLAKCGYCPATAVLSKRSYGVVRFYRDIFSPHIQELSPEIRDVLTLYALKANSKELDDILSQNQCIPVTPNGNKLRSPRELVHPTGDISSVFLPDDERFPHGSQQTYLNDLTLLKLEQLGMAKDEMDWDMMVERAQSVTILNPRDHEGAVKRTAELCRLMKRKLNCRHSYSIKVSDEEEKKRTKAQNSFLEIPFLPVLTRPENFPFRWQAIGPETLVSARGAFPSIKQNLVCTSAPIIQERVGSYHYLTYEIKEFLKLGEKKVPASFVFSQLKQVMSVTPDIRNATAYKFIFDVCTEICNYLEVIYEELTEEQKTFLKQEKVILTDDGFVATNHVALDCSHHLSPYLYRLADTVARNFMKIGVQDKFKGRDYVSALSRMKDEFRDNTLEEKHLRLAVELVQETANCVVDSEEEIAKLELGQIYLPDSENILRVTSDLCINDCLWLPETSGVKYTNPRISSATCKTLGVKTRRTVSLSSCSRGIPFGQKEKLTNRLRGILEAYPCNKDILKELLQNADDAQATEICFIKDPRHHPDKFVLEESWKPLQGPALCVYNNKPFTSSDLHGIQNLGEGGKGEDPNKTGQYGVGFNSVYHLTDVPSFVSKGAEIGEVLCAFDPQCKYVPGATPEEPGRMYNDVTEMEQLYTDVFPCYKLGDRFPLEDAVMFRFPLRSDQKMAETSDISHSVVTLEDLDDLMDDFKAELFEVLLFVNNVKEISLWEIDEKSGIPKERYRVKANLKPKEQKKRQEFGRYTRNVTRQLKKEGKQLSKIQMKEVTYVMTLEDSCGHKEEWLVAQRLGFEEKVEIPQSVLTAYQQKDLGLLPRGGVATLLSRAGGAVTRPMKAYCFLPLPCTTYLPVNINGHFALDHEARRNLWRDEAEGFRGDWNNLLLQEVVAACYVTLLDRVRNFLHLEPNEDHVTCLNCTRLDISSRLERLKMLLPGVEVALEDPYWVTLTESVYKYVDKHQVRILPVVRDLEANPNVSKFQESGVPHSFSVYWFSPTGKGKDEAFFNDLENFPSPPSNPADENLKRIKSRQKMRDVFQHVLLTTGFNLVEFPLSVFHALLNSGVKAACISPSSVIEFYKSFSRDVPLCNIGQIPAQLSFTPFQNELSLVLVLQYCKRDPEFMEKLDGLPLLLTKDDQLSAFNRQSPVFLSKFTDLLPECARMFVHPTIYRNVFELGSLSHDPEFKVFDVAEFASLLSNTLPKEKYHARNMFSEWSPNQVSVVPNRKWLQDVWKFLSTEVRTMLRNKSNEKVEQDQADGPNTPKKKLSKEDEMQETRDLLAPLNEWNILPATKTDKSAGKPHTKTSHLLFPLKIATSVVDLSSCNLPSYLLRDAFRKLSLPELNWQVLQSSTFSDMEPSSRLLPRCFVATLDDPVAMLEAMREKMNRSALHGKLDHNDAKLILTYFSSNTKRLQQLEHIEVLKRLPLHETIHGDLIEITSRSVFVLPPGIPRHGMDVVENASGVVFLKDNSSLKELHKLLDCKPSSEVAVYCDVVFEHFNKLTEGDRYAHLEFIRMELLPRLQLREDTKDGQEKLISSLSKLEFLPKPRSNSYGKASTFYDPSHGVFQVMLPLNLFPPEPFNKPKWLSFLRIIGLIQEVTSSKFVEFANEVATEAQALRNDNTREKSETLISHLFSRPNVVDDYHLEQVSTIPFIASEHVSQALQNLHSQHGHVTTDGHLAYIAFINAVAWEKKKLVWTTAHLLPPSANPRSHIHNFQIGTDCRDNYSAQQYCDSIIQHLNIIEQPCLQQVLQHCRNLCNKLVSENDMSENFEEKRFEDKTSVMSSMYKFFQSNINRNYEGGQAWRDLQNTPCILVESGRRFVYPNQVVIEFLETQEIKPYLYAAPHEFGKFRNIFEQVGCPRTVGCNEYAMVLRMLHRLWPEVMVADPNGVKQILHAVKGFFESLEKDEPNGKPMSFKSLYLPGYMKQRSNKSGLPQGDTLPLYLRQAQTLIYDDAPRHEERLGQFSEMFLVDLKECGITRVNVMDDLLTKIPRDDRPKLLSDVVNEELVDGESDTAIALGESDSLKQRVASQEFCRGIVRLIRHENHRSGSPTDANVVYTIERKLHNIKFYGLEKVVTQLIHKGDVILGSGKVVSLHQAQEIKGGEVIWKIYLSKSVANSDHLSLAITSAIREIAGGQLGESSAIILTMLNTPIHKMWSFLDHLRIRQDDSYDPSLNSPLPEPGSFIPIKDHHLLDNKFQEFDVDNYVGFEIYDASLHGEDEDATFIYAVIMEKIQESCGDIPSFAKKYKINIGRDHEPVIVSAEKLYKFHNVLPASPEGIVMFIDEESQSMAQKQKTKDEIFREITQILEDAWRQPEEVRRRIVKRLYLRWHPDKNLGNEEFCKEVCHYIQSEISRLDSKSSYYGGCYTRFYSGLFVYWGTRASSHRRCRDQYRASFNQHYPRGPRSHYSTSSSCSYTRRYVPPSFSRSNPQPQEARRWLRQAEVDLEAVTNDERSETVFYEWACFKCHQAAEKALKAAHYMVDADKTDTHDLIQNANRLENPELRRLATRLGNLLGNSDHMRYPDTMRSPSIPHDVYTEKMAAEGLELAQRIVAKVAVMVRGGNQE